MSEQLRKAIEQCGKTRAELSRQADVPESALSRFVVNGLELRSGSIDKVCQALRLQLVAKKSKRKK